MATFFGEVLPVSSRAVEDDEDDDDDEYFEQNIYPDAKIIWSKDFAEEKFPCKTCTHLILAIGPVATGFTFAYILPENTEAIAIVKCGTKVKDLSPFQQSLTDKSCVIHRLPDRRNVWVVQCNITILPEQAFNFTKQLLSSITLDAQIFILSTTYLSDYKSANSKIFLEAPFVRTIFTPHFKKSPDFPLLEQPNTVSGLPAAILAQCQIQGQSAVLYCCYSDSIYVHIPAIKSFLPILKTGALSSVVTIKPDAEKVLRHLINLYVYQDSLYT